MSSKKLLKLIIVIWIKTYLKHNCYFSELSGKKNSKETKLFYMILQFMRQDGYCDLLSEVSTVLQLILVLPATNAECERCFSCLKRVKTYLKNALSQKKKLNHLMILNIFEEETEELNLAEVANDFSCQCDKRKEDFGYREFV